MKLELKHLAPYLPYELRIFHSAFMFRNNWNENEIGTMVGITDVVELDVLGETTFDIVMRRDKDFYKLHDSRGHFKSILRPLSDITKEIEINGEKFVPSDKINKCTTTGGTYNWFKISEIGNLKYVNYEVVQKLFEWHFDIFGLIEKGLAIDINTLNK